MERQQHARAPGGNSGGAPSPAGRALVVIAAAAALLATFLLAATWAAAAGAPSGPAASGDVPPEYGLDAVFAQHVAQRVAGRRGGPLATETAVGARRAAIESAGLAAAVNATAAEEEQLRGGWRLTWCARGLRAGSHAAAMRRRRDAPPLDATRRRSTRRDLSAALFPLCYSTR